MDRKELISVLRAECKRAGSQSAYAKQIGVSEQYLSDVLRDKREPGLAILRSLGIERMVTYRRRVEPYDPAFGNDRICICTHRYSRHFDPYQNMAPVGCKYCECVMFQEREDDGEFLR